MTTIPTDSEIIQAVQSLFNATSSLDPNARWNALVPTDPSLTPPPLALGPSPPVTLVPTHESLELIDFVGYFSNQITSSGQIDQNAIRVMLMVYCHIMESDFWPTLIWKQLRLLAGEQPSWHFTCINSGKVCKYPRQKFAEISALALDVRQPIGDIISRIWDGNLRNAFSHSGYYLTDRFIPTGWLSPISRDEEPRKKSYSFDEVSALYRSARALLKEVAFEHSRAINSLQ